MAGIGCFTAQHCMETDSSLGRGSVSCPDQSSILSDKLFGDKPQSCRMCSENLSEILQNFIFNKTPGGRVLYGRNNNSSDTQE